MDWIKKIDPNLLFEGSSLYEAIKDGTLEDGKSVNNPIVTTGPLSGFTALHVACMERQKELVEVLVKDLKADVNVVADNGVQPIHLVCFLDFPVVHKLASIIKLLLEFGANVNTTIGKELFLNYHKNSQLEWCPDFGDQMSLIAYSIIYDKEYLFKLLMMYGADIEIISLTNKTLLMYALEKNLYYIPWVLARTLKNPKLINHRDNDGRSAIHHLFLPEKYGGFRYDAIQQFGISVFKRNHVIKSILEAEADIYALVNGDPDTFLPNMAAYRGCYEILRPMLPYYRDMSLSKALFYTTLPRTDPDKYLRIAEDFDHNFDLEVALPKLRQTCTELILKDLINRQTFGLPVPQDEVKLMEKLVNTDPDIRNMVNKYKTNFINGELKKKVIEFGGKSMTRFEFLRLALNNKKLKLLVKNNEHLMKAWEKTKNDCSEDYYYFSESISYRIRFARERIKLLRELEKISNLREAIPLPYEVVLEIVEYLKNSDLENFIKVFYSRKLNMWEAKGWLGFLEARNPQYLV